MSKIYNSDTYRYRLGYDGKLRVNVLDSLPNDRFLLALTRLRKYVETVKFIPDDSDIVGFKHTHCSWGLCCDIKAVYPDKQDYIWPEEKEIDGLLNVLPPGKKQLCPHDLRKKKDLNGCFFTCAYRKQLENNSTDVDRNEALNRIDNRIKEWRNVLRQK